MTDCYSQLPEVLSTKVWRTARSLSYAYEKYFGRLFFTTDTDRRLLRGAEAAQDKDSESISTEATEVK